MLSHAASNLPAFRVGSYTCHANKACSWHNLKEGVDYAYLSKDTGDCSRCQLLCDAHPGCTAIECGSKNNYCAAWYHNLCATPSKDYGITTCTKNTHVPKDAVAETASTGACWEARPSDYRVNRCTGYREAGYTCVAGWCAAMNPGGTPNICAKKAPPGFVVDRVKGRCVRNEHTTVVKGPSGGSCCGQPAIKLVCPHGMVIFNGYISGTCCSKVCSPGSTLCSCARCDTPNNERWSSSITCGMRA